MSFWSDMCVSLTLMVHRTHILDFHMSRAIQVAFWIVLVLSLTSCQEPEADIAKVYLPITFHAEGKDDSLRTHACLEVIRYWNTDEFGSHGNVLGSVLEAFEHQDRQALLELAHPTLGRDPKEFETQASAFFSQFQKIDVAGVRFAFGFRNFVVFYPDLEYRDRRFSTSLLFADRADGSLGFLPYRTNTLVYTLVNEWFTFDFSGTPPGRDAFCAAAVVQRATHQLSMGGHEKSEASPSRPARLLLRGGPIQDTGPFAALGKRVEGVVGAMKESLEAGKFKEFGRYLTPEGSRRAVEWLEGASDFERERYTSAIISAEPFFVFDASPLVIVYAKTGTRVRVMYFTPQTNGELRWTNSAHITNIDRVFKQGPLYEAASLDRPFENLLLHE